MKFKKTTPLAGLNSGGGKDSDAARRARDEISRQSNLDAIKNSRFPFGNFVTALRLSDSEIEGYLLGNNQDLIARGTVGPKDYSDFYTVPWLGWQCIKNGWAVVPQDRTENRRPSKIPIQVKSGKWGKDVTEREVSFLPTQWRDKLMTVRDFLQFEHVRNANIAVACCAAAMHIRILDIDCRSAELAEAIMRIALEELGTTPFIRIGAKPKVALVFRVAEADSKEQSWSVDLLGADGQPEVDENGKALNAVEWLANGKMLTAFGYHYRTGLNFKWPNRSPLNGRPEEAPLVDVAMLRRFMNRVQALRQVVGAVSSSNPFGNRPSFTEFASTETYNGKLWIPKRARGEWTIDANGKVTDKAEKWLADQAWAYCAANAEKLHFAGVLDELIGALTLAAKKALLGVHRDSPLFQSEASTERAVLDKMQNAAMKFAASMEHKRTTGRYKDGAVPWSVAEDGRRAIAQRVARGTRPADGSLDWVPEETCAVEALAEYKPAIKVVINKKTKEQVDLDHAARELIGDQAERKRIAQSVSDQVGAGIRNWLWNEVKPWNDKLLKDKVAPVSKPNVLLGPTGSGKTFSSVGKLVEFCKAHPRRPGEGPFIYLAPTHANAAELLAVAKAAGMHTPDFDGEAFENEKEIADAEAVADKLKVKIVRFRGRNNFCHRGEEMAELGKQKIGVSSLCEAIVEVGDATDRKRAREAGEKLPTEKLLCSFREAGLCKYWTQMDDLADAEIVVMSHKYLTEKLLRQLKNPRGVLIDESVTYSLLGQVRIPVSTFRQARREPYIKSADKVRWPTWSNDDISAYYIGAREELTAHVLHWIKTGKDIAVELSKLSNAQDLLAASIELCNRANDRSRKVRPDLTKEEVLDLAGEATGRYLIDEIRFWKTVRERINGLADGTAMGPRDMRWQLVEAKEKLLGKDDTEVEAYTPHIRLSWRIQPNWLGSPMLLLDASARPRIVAKQFGVEPIVTKVVAPMRVRTVALIEKIWSNSSFIPSEDASDEELQTIARTIDEARRLITTKAVLFGHGRVLVGSTVKIRDVLTGGGWQAPPNVDFVHYGALRGLDFAKYHVCAISIGRTEQPIGIIDGHVAALSYDDEHPEEPLDKMGTGVTADGKVLFRPQLWSTILMRTGQNVDHLISSMPKDKPVMQEGKQKVDENGEPMVETTWAYELEQSWREEELRQFVGRLRPVFRNIDDDLPPPVWVACGKILPDDTIVDELLELQALLKIWPMAELVRLGGGVLADNVTPKLPGAQEILRGRTLSELAKDLPNGPAFLRRWVGPFVHVRYEVASDEGARQRSAMLLPKWIDGDAVSFWMALSERHGELPEVMSVSEPKLIAPQGKAKPADKRDVDRDDSLLAEIEAREAHHAEPLAADHGRVEFELRRARGGYDGGVDETSPA